MNDVEKIFEIMKSNFELGIELIKGQNVDVELLIDRVFELDEHLDFFKHYHICSLNDTYFHKDTYFVFSTHVGNKRYNYPELKIMLVRYINNLITK